MPIPKPINTPSNSSGNTGQTVQYSGAPKSSVLGDTALETPGVKEAIIDDWMAHPVPLNKVPAEPGAPDGASYKLLNSDGSIQHFSSSGVPVGVATSPNRAAAETAYKNGWTEISAEEIYGPNNTNGNTQRVNFMGQVIEDSASEEVIPSTSPVPTSVPSVVSTTALDELPMAAPSNPMVSNRVESTSLPVIDAQNIESRRVILRPFDFDHPSPDMQEYMQRPDNIMYPVYASGGMVMTYTPTISESSSMDYQSSDISQNNEGFNVYRGTKNRTITLSNVVFTCETPAQGLYALSVIHFLRSYSMTDFGIGRSGRPPSPMWFSAYGKYMYDKVPVLLGGYGFKSSDPELDLIPVPNPEQTSLYSNHKKTNVGRTGSHKAELQLIREAIQNIDYTHHTWLPIKVEIDSITLTVQHTPLYWKTFNLDDYRSGRMASSSTDWLW